MDAIITSFTKLLRYDKDVFFKRCAQYEVWYAIAGMILEDGPTITITYAINDSRAKVFEEFIDFVDGNGFEITDLGSLNGPSYRKVEIHTIGWNKYDRFLP